MARKKRKIKIFNWIIFISAILLLFYIIVSIILLLPFFKDKYTYSINTDNYKAVVTTTFKKNFFTCSIKEKYDVEADSKVLDRISLDLGYLGYKGKNNKFYKKVSMFGFCKKKKLSYKKVHNSDYVRYKLNGESNIKIDYGSNYEEMYVYARVNGKNVNDIAINSNFNKNAVGSYIIGYKLKVKDDYYRFLYRKVSIVDKEKPVITLTGSETVNLDYGNKYDELGYVAIDNYDGTLSSKVKVKGTVNEKKSGVYKLEYYVLDSSGNKATKERIVTVGENTNVTTKKKSTKKATTTTTKKSTTTTKVAVKEPDIKVKDGITYVNGIILVNKKYGLPEDYNPGVNSEAYSQLQKMQADAKALNLDLQLRSGFRSYSRQTELYNNYVKKDGEEKASMYSAKPGYSEHQTGLAFDVGIVDSSFANTNEAKWLAQNCHLYGFIIRYPKDKTDITGYIYEPWHVRYLGVDVATKVKESGLTLEEYLGVN